MTKNNKLSDKIIFGVTVLILSIVPMSYANAATADDRLTIGMSPVSKHYTFDAGSATRDFVTITNAGATPFTFKVSAEPYSVKDVSYEVDYQTVKKNTDLKSWVKFDKTTYDLAAKSSVKVYYTVTVPGNATPGGHYGVIFAETQPSTTSGEGASLQQKSRVGSVIYSTVKGDYKTGGQFKGIRTPGLQFKSPLKSELNVENTGSTDFGVDTVFAVFDIFGNRKFTESKTFQILPQTERKIQLEWAKSPGFGFYKVTTSAKFLDQQTTKTSFVLMAPIAYYMIFVIGLLVAVIYFVAKRR